VTVPSGVIRPTWLKTGSVNQTLPSGPAVIPPKAGASYRPNCETANSLMAPVFRLSRPIWSTLLSSNQMLPSGPAVMLSASALGVGIAKSVTVPLGVTRSTVLPNAV